MEVGRILHSIKVINDTTLVIFILQPSLSPLLVGNSLLSAPIAHLWFSLVPIGCSLNLLGSSLDLPDSKIKILLGLNQLFLIQGNALIDLHLNLLNNVL